ncbi:MAG: PQQ-dependent dehydrogenase, methanol/ethanol family [Pseudomonadota bacterium]
MKRLVWLALIVTGPVFAGGDVDEERVISESAAGENWFLKGGNFRGQHFSPLAQVNRANVADLGLAWSRMLPSPDGIAATPIVIDGVLYISASWSVVYAIDAKNGKVLWKYDPDVRARLGDDPSMSWPARAHRGLAVWQGKVFVSTADCRLIALDAATGKPAWTEQTCDIEQGYAITDSPYVGGDLVFIGNSGSESGERNRGYVSAYDADSGELRWRFYTVPSHIPEENTSDAMQMAAATWSGDALEKFGGGGSVWNEMTYDPESGLLFFGTAGALPYMWHERSPDGLDNLFTSSVIAIDASSGDYVWHYQTVPQDSWEYNANMNIVLADIPFENKQRKVLMIAPKNGFHYVLDRLTGELLDAEKFARVNWASHINLETGRPVYDPDGRFWEKETERNEVWPNMWGAHSWQPMSYHPRLNLVYIPVIDHPTITFDQDGNDYEDTSEVRRVVDGKPFDPGKLLAIDPSSGAVRWSVPHTMPYNGGVMATAGDLVFQGDAYGRFNAFDAATGEKLWSVKTGSRITAAPASYAIDGTQYVVIPVGAGGGLQWVYPELHAADEVLGPTRLMAFALGAKSRMPAEMPDMRRLPDQPALTASQNDIKYGKQWYHSACSGCHGKNAVTRFGGSVADLRFSTADTHANWDDIVIGGSRKDRGMPGFGDMPVEGSQQIRAYILSLSEQLREERK